MRAPGSSGIESYDSKISIDPGLYLRSLEIGRIEPQPVNVALALPANKTTNDDGRLVV